MAAHLRYVRRRNAGGVYYYERRIPQAVLDRPEEWRRYFGGVALYRRSLGTKHQSEAMRLGAEAHNEFERRKNWAIGNRSTEAAQNDSATRALTLEALQKIKAATRDMIVRPWARHMVLAELGGEHAEELERMIHQRELDGELLVEVLKPPVAAQQGQAKKPELQRYLDEPRFPNLAEYVEGLIRQERLYAPEGSDAWAVITKTVREGMVAGEKDVDAMLTGQMSAIPVEKFSNKNSAAPRISEIVTDYIGQLTAGRTIREVKGALASFVSVVGDIPIDEVTRADFIRFCQIEGARIVGGKDPKSIVRPVSPDTLKKKVGLLRSAINRAIKMDIFPGPNPAANIDTKVFTKPVPKALMPNKRPFNVHELQLILKHPWFTGCKSETVIHEPGEHRLTGMHYWVPILAMYSGCRAGELGGLRISEIRLDHQHPHIVIQDNGYRTTKGSYSRNVPILDVLLEHGFAEFVERVAKADHDRLFPKWRAPAGRVDASSTAWSNADIIRSFNRTVLWQQLKGILEPGVRQVVTFHSFRGAFKTLLGRQEYGIQVNYKHEVIGHAKDALDERYVGEIDIAETYAAVRRCRYHGLTLPPAP